jgi:amino acid transporter
MLNMRTGGIIQSAFMGLKAIPIFFAIIVGFFLLQGANFTAVNYIWEGIPSVIPLVLYAAIGFEAACSISAHIENPARNAPRAVYISFAVVIIIAALYQFLFYGAVGQAIAHAVDFRGTFPELLKLIIPGAASAQRIVTGILYAAVASSALGGAYGIIFSNTWNLYALAKHGHTFASSSLIQLNQHGIPWLCVLVEGVICTTYLLISRGAQVPLQQISGLASVLAYTMSIIALAYARIGKPHISALLPIAGLASCLILGTSCIVNLIFNGASSLITFAAFISFGIAMFAYTKRHANSFSAS